MSRLSKKNSNNEPQPLVPAEQQKSQLSAENYCEQGQILLDEGKPSQALEYYQAAIDADKHMEQAYLLLSEAYEKQGKLDKAKATLYALLAENPNNKKARDGIKALDKSNVVGPKSASTGTITFQSANLNSNKAQNGNNGSNCKAKGRNEFWGVFRIILIIAVIVIVDIILIANDVFEIHRGGTLLFLIDLIILVLLGKLFGLGD